MYIRKPCGGDENYALAGAPKPKGFQRGESVVTVFDAIIKKPKEVAYHIDSNLEFSKTRGSIRYLIRFYLPVKLLCWGRGIKRGGEKGVPLKKGKRKELSSWGVHTGSFRKEMGGYQRSIVIPQKTAATISKTQAFPPLLGMKGENKLHLLQNLPTKTFPPCMRLEPRQLHRNKP